MKPGNPIPWVLLLAVIVLFIITAYLMAHGIKTAAALMRKRAATT